MIRPGDADTSWGNGQAGASGLSFCNSSEESLLILTPIYASLALKRNTPGRMSLSFSHDSVLRNDADGIGSLNIGAIISEATQGGNRVAFLINPVNIFNLHDQIKIAIIINIFQ